MTLIELLQKRAKAVADMRAMTDKLTAEKRDKFTAEEEAEFTRINGDVDSLKVAIDREERQLALEGEMGKSLRGRVGAEGGEERGDERKAEYRKAFDAFVRRGINMPAELRDYTGDVQHTSANSGADGGYLIPDDYDREIQKTIAAVNAVRGLATVRSIAGNTIKVPTRTTLPTATVEAELGAFATGKVVYGQLEIALFKMALAIPISVEMLEDSAFNMDAELIEALGESFGVLEESWLVNGGGTTEPYGIKAGAQTGVTTASATAITADELMGLYYSLKSAYRAKATWLTKDATALAIRKLKDGNGNYVWQPGLLAGEPDRLLGKPMAFSDQCEAMTANLKPIYFGDFSKFRIVENAGINLLRDPYTERLNGVVVFSAYKRVGSRLVQPEAVKALVMHA